MAIKENNEFTPIFGKTNLSITYVSGSHGSLSGIVNYAADYGDPLPGTPNTQANAGYAFDKWIDTSGNTVIPGTSIVNGDSSVITAIFGKDDNGDEIPDEKQWQYDVTFQAGSNGSVNGTTSYKLIGGLLSDPSTKTLTLKTNAVPKFIAPNLPKPVANSGYAFSDWLDKTNAIVSNVENFAITDHYQFTAKFGKDDNGDEIPDEKQWQYDVTFQAGSNGSVSGTTSYKLIGGLLSDPSTKTLTLKTNAVPKFIAPNLPKPVANSGYAFSDWLDKTNAIVSNVENFAITDHYQFTAKFGKDDNGDEIPDEKQWQYDVTFQAGSNGSVNGTTSYKLIGGLLSDPSTKTLTLKTNAVPKFIAPTLPKPVANSGYAFSDWLDKTNAIVSNVENFAITDHYQFTAKFETSTYEFQFLGKSGALLQKVQLTDGISVNSQVSLSNLETLARADNPNKREKFAGWLDTSDNKKYANRTIGDIIVTKPTSYKAYFKASTEK